LCFQDETLLEHHLDPEAHNFHVFNDLLGSALQLNTTNRDLSLAFMAFLQNLSKDLLESVDAFERLE
jgi:hypothetical protein